MASLDLLTHTEIPGVLQITSFKDFFNPTNENAVGLLGIPLVNRLSDLLPGQMHGLGVADRIKIAETALEVAGKFVQDKIVDIANGEDKDFASIAGLAMTDGDPESVKELLADKLNTDDGKVVMAIANLTYAIRLSEYHENHGIEKKDKLHPEIKDRIRLASLQLAPLIQVAFSQEIQTSKQTATESKTGYSDWQSLVDAAHRIMDEGRPIQQVRDTYTFAFLCLTDTVKDNLGGPEAIATLFKRSDPKIQQQILQELYDSMDKADAPMPFDAVALMLAKASIPQEMRKLTPGSRQVVGKAEGIHESTNMGETIVAVETPEGLFYGLTWKDWKNDDKPVYKIFSSPGNFTRYTQDNLPAGYKVI